LYRKIEEWLRCSWETVSTFSHNDPQRRGIPGAISVLHAHSRRLDFHPPVHRVMPAAALDADRRLWRTRKKKGNKSTFLFNPKALAKVFRAKLLDAFTREGLCLPGGDPEKWVVDSGDKTLLYLGRYVYRGVIQEKPIITCRNGQVTFRYRASKTRKTAKDRSRRSFQQTAYDYMEVGGRATQEAKAE